MNKHLKNFLHRGLIFGGFGPIVVAIIALFVPPMSAKQMFVAIISTYLLAFLHAGASVFNQIEEWSMLKSLTCHFGLLYLAYVICYLVNTWIAFDVKTILIFTLIFAVIYFTVWIMVVTTIKLTSRKLNSKLNLMNK